MKSTTDRKLDEMVRSLREHAILAKELKLNFVAQLLTMTAMEIRMTTNRISDQEIDTLCSSAAHPATERPTPLPEPTKSARVIRFPKASRLT